MTDWPPFSPLFFDLLTPQAQALLNKSRQVGEAGGWEQAEQVAQEAQEMRHKGGDWFGCAAVLASLAQVCRQGEEPGLARRYNEEARQVIARRISPNQQFREALTTYSAALFNQLIGSTTEAQRLFGDTVAILGQAESRFLVTGNERLARRCRRLAREIAEQGELAARADTRERIDDLYANFGGTMTWNWPDGVFTTRRFLAGLETLRYLIARRLRVGDKTFRAHSADGEEEEVLVFKPGEDYFVLEIPRQAPAAEEGDYLLLRRTGATPTETPEQADPVEYALFARDEAGRVKFTPPATVEERYAHVIGEGSEVVSLLKLLPSTE
jgi:hypothetical protein